MQLNYSYYVNNKNRTTNLKIASKKINGTIIQPGETFDFNKVVGSRTAAKDTKRLTFLPVKILQQWVLPAVFARLLQLYLTLRLFQMLKLLNAINTAKGYLMFRLVEMLPFQAMFKISDGKIIQSMQLKLRWRLKAGKITCTFYTCQKAKPKKVKLKVTQKGKTFYIKKNRQR